MYHTNWMISKYFVFNNPFFYEILEKKNQTLYILYMYLYIDLLNQEKINLTLCTF